jgi:hypothetical protein
MKQLFSGREDNSRTQMQNQMLQPNTFHKLQWQLFSQLKSEGLAKNLFVANDL